MIFEKINTKTLREHVYERLREAILSGKIVPGQSITLRSLSEQFGVSLMPVREALWQLESEDIIILESNRRFHVNSLTSKQMEEALRLRKLLEAEAAVRACRLHSEEDAVELHKLLDAQRRAVNNHVRYMQRNLAFHFYIYSHSESPMLVNFIRQLWARSGPYYVIHPSGKEDLEERLRYHKRMYEAFVARDEAGLIEAIHNDAEHATELILPFLNSHGE
jgi:DNA-binding GntR family transcriptional regulator